MRRSVRRLCILMAVLVAGCLVAGCSTSVGSSVKSAISSLSTQTAVDSTTPADTITPTPTAPVTPTITTTTTVTATATASTPTPTPTTTTPTATAPSSATATSTGSGSNLLWLWILLGALVLIALIVLIVRSSRSRSATAADSRARLIDAYAKGSALHDAMSVAETPGALTAGDAGARWADIQRRADDLTQTLYTLRDTLPDPEDRARVADTLGSLQAVRSAMDAERAPGGASPEQADVVRRRLYAFEASLQSLRAGSEEPL